ncbi:MAG TPA: hypothetical protein VM554_10090 [Acidisarcina sp.]|nr:hypothetical protein [Acidisarcina sp.]
MRRILSVIALLAVASFVTANRASAQEHAIKANVPFDFTVGDQLLPPGTYRITSGTSHEVLLEGRGVGISVFVMGTADYKYADAAPKLVFHKIGDQYFLNEVVSTSASGSVMLLPTKLEKRARMQNAALRNEERTIVAMK